MNQQNKPSPNTNILYLDKDQSVAEYFQRMLAKEGLDTDIAHSDEQALNFVNQQCKSYAVILISLYPSVLNDNSVIELLARSAPHACLMLLVDDDMDIPEQQTVSNNITAIVTKPWGDTELLHALHQALELHSTRLASILSLNQQQEKKQDNKLLLNDDNLTDCDLIIELLNNATTHADNKLQVQVSTSLAEALFLLKTQQFSIVLTKLNLPDSQGLNTIVALYDQVEIPIIVISGHKEIELAQQSLKLGAQDYLEKESLTAAMLQRAIQFSLGRHYTYREQRQLLLQNPDGIMVLDDCGTILFANPAAAKLCDIEAKQLVGEMFCLAPSEHNLTEIRLQSGRYVEMHALNTDWHGLSARIVTLRDISDHKHLQDKLHFLATHDPLTGLGNRHQLNKFITRMLQNVERRDSMAAILMLDLDHFKLINDTFGHSIGDELLIEIATRLSSTVRDTDTVARIGGDEFVIIIEDIERNDNIAHLAEKIQCRLADAFMVADKQLNVTVSIGIALCPKDGKNVEALLKSADAAMYRAKLLGRNHYQFHDEALHQSTMRHLAMQHQLQHALTKQEFCLYLQPQVSKSGIEGAEVLLRWHPEGQAMVSPADFIPLLEQSGLIFDVELWVLEQSCSLLQQWQQQGSKLHLSVNLSAVSLQKPALPDIIAGLLARYQVPPACLEIEIVESVLLNDLTQARATLNSLDALGVSINLDDFGTGYSSIGYLLEFDMIDVLKLDCSFVWKMEETPRNWAILKSVVNLAHSLEMGIVAEGIETPRQLELLLSLGCDCYQGYLFAKPMPLADWPTFVASWQGRPSMLNDVHVYNDPI